jgi:UDP:flavonoid glycosyltransferase YjiC (YdhE family)
MKIVLATYGSRGDVQPMLALALGLQSKGHAVLLVGPPEWAGWAEQSGCPYLPLGEDVTAFIDRMSYVQELKSVVDSISFVRRGIVSQFALLPAMIAGADLVVGSSLNFALASVAESMGIAYRYIAFTPQLLPSGDHPSPIIKAQYLPRWLNRLTWLLNRMADKIDIRPLINYHRKRIGLRPLADVWSCIFGPKTIVSSDRAISTIPPDAAPKDAIQSGYMHLFQSVPVSHRLEEFLEAGPEPVYAGFGSMPGKDQIRCVSTIVQAARLAGRRAVIARFWGEPSACQNAPDIFFIRNYPHLNLFPRMAAIIHHGGAGTTAAAAISGRPQIIVPHILDQYYWGRRIHRAGLGPGAIHRSRLNTANLAAAIDTCMSDASIRQTAASTAAVIRKTDGVALTIAGLLNS